MKAGIRCATNAGRSSAFTSDIGSQLRVTGDAPRLEQVFVTNAVKYTPDNGRVSLRAWHRNGEVVVAITDNGAGISAELLPHIFDLFRQADSTLDRARGLGIGLNVAAAREFHPEVLLLDLGLPGFDGYEVARILRAEAPFADALFIAISGYAQDGDRQRCLASGFDEHFPKPFDLEKLIQAIHSRRPA